MRLCRFGPEASPGVGFYDERGIVPLGDAAAAVAAATGERLDLPASSDLLALLPPDGPSFPVARRLAGWLEGNRGALSRRAVLDPAATPLLVPIPRPNKVFLLAGNYAEHIREGGGTAAERAETFPYVFMKPPSTTLTPPGRPVRIPAAAPDAVDWQPGLAAR